MLTQQPKMVNTVNIISAQLKHISMHCEHVSMQTLQITQLCLLTAAHSCQQGCSHLGFFFLSLDTLVSFMFLLSVFFTFNLTNFPLFLCAQEYFSIPLSSLRSVLSAAYVTTVRLILQYYSRNKDTLQVNAIAHPWETYNIYQSFPVCSRNS